MMRRGRPKVKQNHEATFYLDKVAFVCNDPSMAAPPKQDVVSMMQLRLVHDIRGIKQIREEMKGLAEAYNRYVDLRDRLDKHVVRAQRIMGILGRDLIIKAKEPMGAEQLEAKDGQPIVSMPTPEDLRSELPLWLAVQEYLLIVPEAKVGEIASFLHEVGIPNVSRQAIESALKRHHETFQVRKRGKEKLVSLKRREQDS